MKRLLVFITLLAILLAFTACDGTGEGESSAQPESNTSQVSSDADKTQTSSQEGGTESVNISSPEQIVEIIDDTPSYEDMYDSQKVDVVGNEVIQTSVAGDITQKLRFIFNKDKTELETVRFEFYLDYEGDLSAEADLYKELGYKILEIDKKHIVMQPSDEKIEDWRESYPTMEQLAEELRK